MSKYASPFCIDSSVPAQAWTRAEVSSSWLKLNGSWTLRCLNSEIRDLVGRIPKSLSMHLVHEVLDNTEEGAGREGDTSKGEMGAEDNEEDDPERARTLRRNQPMIHG